MPGSELTTITSCSSLRSSLIFMSFFTLWIVSPDDVSFLSRSASLMGSGSAMLPILRPVSVRMFLEYGDGERRVGLQESAEEALRSFASFPGERLYFAFTSAIIAADPLRSSRSFSV